MILGKSCVKFKFKILKLIVGKLLKCIYVKVIII